MAQTPPVGKLKRYLTGQLLTQENELSRRLFIIKSGKVSVFKTHMGQKVVLSTLGEGEIFGELSFIEASPRSASVEALTTVDAYVVDAEDVNAQIEKLPEWILPIFRTVFARLRAADQRTINVHGLSGFERKHFGKDNFTQKAYRELFRSNALLRLAYSDARLANKPLSSEDIPTLFNEILGDVSISAPLFLKVLKDQGFLVREELEKNKRVVLNTALHDAWIQDLQREIGSERYLRLSDAGLAVLREINEALQAGEIQGSSPTERIEVSLATIRKSVMAHGDLAIEELQRADLVERPDVGLLVFVPDAIQRAYGNQTVLRLFTPEQRTRP